jgi:hypothetical protein
MQIFQISGGIFMSNDVPEPQTETICETDRFIAWRADEPDGESTYHLELNNITLHFFHEEWADFLKFLRILIKSA